MNADKKPNLTMLCDFYELTMGNGYFQCGYKDRITYFDVFFRTVPDNGGFAIAAGLEQAVRYIQQLHFDEDDIAYLRGRGIFSEDFLSYLRDFRFTGDIWAVPEGTPIFPREPDRHQSKPRRPRGKGPDGPGIRLPARTGQRRRDPRRARGLHRRLCRHGLHHLRPALRRLRRRHDGALLGADVRFAV